MQDCLVSLWGTAIKRESDYAGREARVMTSLSTVTLLDARNNGIVAQEVGRELGSEAPRQPPQGFPLSEIGVRAFVWTGAAVTDSLVH